MYASIFSMGLSGIEPYLVRVEVDSHRGLPGFDIVGLPDASVRESRDRVKSVVRNLGYPFPNAKILTNLAPADTKKEGSVYDLPILLALLHASGCETLSFDGAGVIGEIGLSGELRGVHGVLPMVLDAGRLGLTRVIVPVQNAPEASVAQGVDVFAAEHASQVIAFFKGTGTLPAASDIPARPAPQSSIPDLSDVKGQQEARRAMEIAAAGSHNLLFIGPPGTGKSMLAKRLPSILPNMSHSEAIETTKIYSVAGLLGPGQTLLTGRPFRAPHHTVSPAALTGGGSSPKPGDLSLAHNGVLFLDEIPEFSRAALEVLRQPLEDGQVSISRVRQRLTYPGRVMLVAAMNPCPCGYYGHPSRPCTCSPVAIQKYVGRISGPLLDRIDIHVEALPIGYDEISSQERPETSEQVRKRVLAARQIQSERYAGTAIRCNADIPPAALARYCRTDEKAAELLKAAFERLSLSARAHDRILKVARTIADLDGAESIGPAHISQAIQFRSLDRTLPSHES